MSEEIKINSNGIKQAIDDLVNENEMLQDKIYKLENIIKEVREYLNENEIKGVYLDCKLYETKVYKDILEILDKENNNG